MSYMCLYYQLRFKICPVVHMGTKFYYHINDVRYPGNLCSPRAQQTHYSTMQPRGAVSKICRQLGQFTREINMSFHCNNWHKIFFKVHLSGPTEHPGTKPPTKEYTWAGPWLLLHILYFCSLHVFLSQNKSQYNNNNKKKKKPKNKNKIKYHSPERQNKTPTITK